MRWGFGILRLVMVLAVVVASPLAAQSVPQGGVLVLDPDRLFAETKLGQRINQDYLAERNKLIARNRALEAELEAEELELTQMRTEKTPDEFRKLADEFDARVQDIRRDSERAVRDLERSRDQAPVTFMRMVEPVLTELMRETGGAVILDARSILLRSNAADITSVAIARVDATIGDGAEPDTEGDADLPQTDTDN